MKLAKPQEKRTIRLTEHSILRSDAYQYRLKVTMTNLSISRRAWPDYIADTLYKFDGDILIQDGRLWPIPCVGSVCGDPRWISYFLANAGMKIRRLDRLELLDACFQIQHPLIHSHFIR